MIPHQHVSPWDAHTVENGIPVIFQIEAVLGPDVSRLDPTEVLVCGPVPDWNNKGMDSVPFFVDDQLG